MSVYVRVCLGRLLVEIQKRGRLRRYSGSSEKRFVVFVFVFVVGGEIDTGDPCRCLRRRCPCVLPSSSRLTYKDKSFFVNKIPIEEAFPSDLGCGSAKARG